MPSYPKAHMAMAAEILAQPVRQVGDGPNRLPQRSVPSVHTRSPFRRAYPGTLYGPEADGFVLRKTPKKLRGPSSNPIDVGCTVKGLDYLRTDPRGNPKGEGDRKGFSAAK